MHTHSRFSRATSEQMTIKEIARYAKMKGLQVVGTGDFTHPQWLREIEETLTSDGDTQLLKLKSSTDQSVRFLLTSEVCTIFDYEGQSRKVHHVILAPDVESVIQINEALGSYGSLTSDGRPILNMTAPQLVEAVMSVSATNLVFPAHAWTPWFSIFGAFSGFDTIEECYQDMSKHIRILETGLSSDPPMNWRLSKLDGYTLVSNSDCHSFWPWRLGREANVFELTHVTYREIIDAIKIGDPSKFKFTIETDPAYGKYHWTGHRNCNVSLSASEARKLGNICPVCGRKLTEGVEQRVEELADRSEGYQATGKPGFLRLLPLSEIIATVIDAGSPSTQAVWKIYSPLITRFGDEYAVLIDASKEELTAAVVDTRIAEAIVSVREGKAKVVPGYDGVYGKLMLPKFEEAVTTDSESQSSTVARIKPPRGRIQQSSLGDFL